MFQALLALSWETKMVRWEYNQLDGEVRASIEFPLIAKYTILEQGQSQIVFSPDGKYIATGGRRVLIWRNQNFNELLATGCDWLKEYLATRPEEKQRLKVCQGNSNSK